MGVEFSQRQQNPHKLLRPVRHLSKKKKPAIFRDGQVDFFFFFFLRITLVAVKEPPKLTRPSPLPKISHKPKDPILSDHTTDYDIIDIQIDDMFEDTLPAPPPPPPPSKPTKSHAPRRMEEGIYFFE